MVEEMTNKSTTNLSESPEAYAGGIVGNSKEILSVISDIFSFP